MRLLDDLLAETAARHRHLCPRQVLGVRMGILAARCLNLDLPQSSKRLFTFVETDGCFADGVSVSTGCWLGRRTLRLIDYGKVAATFVDTKRDVALRIVPQPDIRVRASQCVPYERSRWHTQLRAYEVMSDDMLLDVQSVTLNVPLKWLISRPRARVNCMMCGEEIINEREVVQDGQVMCQKCGGKGYYHVTELAVCE